jgi:hypothetical protein
LKISNFAAILLPVVHWAAVSEQDKVNFILQEYKRTKYGFPGTTQYRSTDGGQLQKYKLASK